ncbi:MAG: hypothetical protein ACT4P7_19635 [Gemmatimonadaceae bacterium]
MRRLFVLVPAGVALVSLASASIESSSHRARPTSHDVGHGVEVRRIQAHFDSVLSELAARDLPSLSGAQRANRSALVTTLRGYRDRGVFPHNYEFRGEAVPYFVDRRTGTLCAVAHLMASTGRRDLVDDIAAMNNNIWVAQLEGNVEVERWVKHNGLTLEEAARIQVPYLHDGSPIVTTFGSRNNAWLVGTSVTAGAAAASALWNGWGNADGHRRLGTILGLTTSALALGFGGAAMSDPTAPSAVAPVSIASGVVGAFLSTRGLLRNRQAVASRREADRARGVARFDLAPIVPVPGANGAGIALSVRF